MSPDLPPAEAVRLALTRSIDTPAAVIVARKALAAYPELAPYDAIWAWLKHHVRYQRDNPDVIPTIEDLDLVPVADCAGTAVAGAAMLHACEIPWRTVLGFAGDVPVHVWTDALVGEDWYPIDPTPPLASPGESALGHPLSNVTEGRVIASADPR